MMYSTRISIHALLAESDYPSAGCHPRGADFYPRSPCGERPPCQRHGGQPGHFYPRSPCGERLDGVFSHTGSDSFLSTLSLRRATSGSERILWPVMNFYPRSPCGERPRHTVRQQHPQRISIHALLAESDFLALSSDDLADKFLSTLSLRRATRVARTPTTVVTDFYPRSPCGERPAIGRRGTAGRDNFYPRSPCGERLVHITEHASPGGISIHALLAESDAPGAAIGHRLREFLSTLSLRRATIAP